MPFRSRHVWSALALHTLLFVFLIIGVRCAPKMQPPPVIEALVITGKNKEGKLKTEPPPPAEPTPEPPKPEPPPPEPEPPPPEPEPEPEPPKPDPAIEQKKLEEAKRKEEAAKLKRETEIKRLAEIQRKKEEEEKKKKEELEAKRKAEEELKKKQEEEERKKKEEEKRKLEEEKRKLEEERKRKADEQRRLKEEMERSLAQEAEARAEAARIGEVQKTWAQVLASHIESRWLRPPSLPSGLRCRVKIDLLPNGEVVAVQILTSSGNQAFDLATENAVYKSSPLPLPEDPKAFERQLIIWFDPDGLN